MNILTTIIVLLLVFVASFKTYEVADVTNGLERNGTHVCYFDDQVSKKVQQSFQQQTLTTVETKTCCLELIKCWRWCKITRKASKSYLMYSLMTRYFDRRNYHCCSGWDKLNSSSTTCEKPICDIDCHHGECTSPNKCTCEKGYEGTFCEHDINECKNASQNQCEQTCVNIQEGYKCGCKAGFILNADNETCSDINECDVETPPCGCSDKGPCNATCINLPGSYECKCDDGFQFDAVGKCEDINECLLQNNSCGEQRCVNTPGGFRCECHKGYKHNGTSCEDINECDIDNGGCLHTCHNLNGTHICSCDKGYYLMKDEKTCKAINNTSLKRSVTCESDVLGYIDCDHPNEVISIINVMYGRLSTDVCQFNDYTSDTRCVSSNPMQYLQQCKDLNSCIFYVPDDQKDLCPGIEKYFDVSYECKIPTA